MNWRSEIKLEHEIKKELEQRINNELETVIKQKLESQLKDQLEPEVKEISAKLQREIRSTNEYGSSASQSSASLSRKKLLKASSACNTLFHALYFSQKEFNLNDFIEIRKHFNRTKQNASSFHIFNEANKCRLVGELGQKSAWDFCSEKIVERMM